MLSRNASLAFAMALVLTGSSSRASENNWDQYIGNGNFPETAATIGMTGLDVITTGGEILKLGAPKWIPSLGLGLEILKAVPDARIRMENYNLSGFQAALEQAAIVSPSMAVGVALGAGLVATACVASVVCALGTVVAGVGVVAVPILIHKMDESLLNYANEKDRLTAQQKETEALQKRVDAMRALKQQLQAQKNTKEWQAQRTAQLAQQRQKTAALTSNSTNPSVTNKPTNPATKTLNAPQGRPPTSANVPTSTPYVYTTSSQRTVTGTRTGTSNNMVLSPAEIQSLKRNAIALKPPSQPAAPPSQPMYVAPVRTAYTGFQGSRPGGVSLSLAAAMRMRLDLNLEGSYFKDGQIVLAGRRNSEHYIDAALFLTALRASCEPGDPYFSLDADNGATWNEDGEKLRETISNRLRGDLHWDSFDENLGNGLTIRSFSVRRDYPRIWRELAPKYPNLKTRLVFRPEFLRETRFGEILYKADVLLKELAAGAPALDTSSTVRAATIDRYVSASERSAGKGLLASVEGATRIPDDERRRGFRLWFDFAPQLDGPGLVPIPVTPRRDEARPNSRSAAALDLREILRSRGYFGAPPSSERQISLVSDENALDLSEIYPKMFVKLHDLAAGQDLEGKDPNHEELSEDVNRRIERYAGVYPELRALLEVFRAYVVAIQVFKRDATVCNNIRPIPLLDAEKTSQPLPGYHPSEIFFTVAKYTYSTERQKSQPLYRVGTVSGGISVSGKRFYDRAIQPGRQTVVTQDIKREVARQSQVPSWTGSSGRQFIALTVDSADLLAEAGDLRSLQAATPEDVLRKQQELQDAIANRIWSAEETAAKRAYEIELEAWRGGQARWEEAQQRWEKSEKSWQEAEERSQTEERKAIELEETRRLTAQFGPSIDPRTATIAIPYATMSGDVYRDDASDISTEGMRRLANWETLFRLSGYSEHQIQLIKSSGFFAAIYENQRTGDITIAYRGTQIGPSGRAALARLANLDIQHKTAADLAWIVKRLWSHVSLSLTGHAFGGELAAFAAEQIGGVPIVTFNAASASALTRGSSGNRIDIEWVDR